VPPDIARLQAEVAAAAGRPLFPAFVEAKPEPVAAAPASQAPAASKPSAPPVPKSGAPPLPKRPFTPKFHASSGKSTRPEAPKSDVVDVPNLDADDEDAGDTAIKD